MKPKAFLSYRHNLQPEIAGKDALIAAIDAQQKLELVYDKSVTELGDSVTAFMEELISARCIYLFISKDYFESAYTLFELITISEHEEADKKVILPVCLSEEMINIYDYTSVKVFWDKNRATRDALGLLLSGSGRSRQLIPDHDAMWERIYKAWLTIVNPYLHELKKQQEPSDPNSLICQSVDKSSRLIVEAIRNTEANDVKIIRAGIAKLIEKQPLLKAKLVEQLEKPEDIDTTCLAEALLMMPGEDSIPELTTAATRLKALLGKSSLEWRELFFDIQQISGCLLLKTIDSVWWFEHELELRCQARQGITASGFSLDHHAFVEVIVSKELLSVGSLKSPRFTLGRSGSKEIVIPGGAQVDTDYNTMMFFEAVDINATAQHLLGSIYEDLVKSAAPACDAEELISEIKYSAISHKKISGKRPVYYIVSEGYLKQVKAQKWFPKFESALKGSLQFVCWNQETLADSGQVTLEDQNQLIHDFQRLLLLNKD